MYEIALTKGRHEIISAISGDEVQDAFFGNTVENVLDVKSHMEVITKLALIQTTILSFTLQANTTVSRSVAAWLRLTCPGYANAVSACRDTYLCSLQPWTGQYHLVNALLTVTMGSTLTGTKVVPTRWRKRRLC